MGEAVRETIDRCERLIESLLVLARSEAAGGPRGSRSTWRRWRATASPTCTRAREEPGRARGRARASLDSGRPRAARAA